MARLYADEDFPLPVVEELRHLGHGVRTVQDGPPKRAAPVTRCVVNSISGVNR